uniref:alpha-1,3-mannosyl-glycoprotein 4-beta-N-acetylglucosaminyltransferase C-like isoform X1 n=2 Tax=Myxine glutinosa TaxID=7769 RepID=UPI00358F2844
MHSRCNRRWLRLAGLGLLSCIFLSLLLLIFIDKEISSFGETQQQRLAKEILMKQLHSGRNGWSFRNLTDANLPLNITYEHLAGFLLPRKKFLAVGMSSIHRRKGSYLMPTLSSVFEQLSNEELADIVVVVHLADDNVEWCRETTAAVASKFAPHVLRGRLLIIHAPHSAYPPLRGLKRNFNDPQDRVTFRSKQNVDYAFLMNFCANISTFYLMLEDDVTCARNYLNHIRQFIASRGPDTWATLEFSKLGYIGKLYRSADLPRLARFLLLFYQEMPCDWLLSHFRILLAQGDAIRFKPSLFQHVGYYSSFRGTANKLRDDDFEEEPTDIPDNPPAGFVTDIEVFEDYHPHKAYGMNNEYFWGKSPSVGKSFRVLFRKPVNIMRVRVQTGSEDRKGDFLRGGTVELGHRPVLVNKGQDCGEYIVLGSLKEGFFETKDVTEKAQFAANCLRLKVTQNQSEWLIIRSISVWMADNT